MSSLVRTDRAEFLRANTYQDALTIARLDYKVALTPLYTRVQDQLLPVEIGKSATRLDKMTPIGLVGNRYAVVQNSDENLALLMNAFHSRAGGSFVGGGYFGQGEKVFLQYAMPQTIVLSRNDELKTNLTLINSFDGSTPLMVFLSNVRIVCENTFRMALKQGLAGSDTFRIRHSANAEFLLKQAETMALATMDRQQQIEQDCRYLLATPFSSEQIAKAAKKVFDVKDGEVLSTRTKNNAMNIFENFERGQGIDSSNRGTAWAAFNAFTEYADHSMTVKNESERSFARLESNLLGASSVFKQKALVAIQEQIAA